MIRMSPSFSVENQEKAEWKNEKLFLIRNLLVFRPEGTPFEDGESFSYVFYSIGLFSVESCNTNAST